jgi:peptidoglycan/xylan/chitin deacetylase (PgdA/CDA1 family)
MSDNASSGRWWGPALVLLAVAVGGAVGWWQGVLHSPEASPPPAPRPVVATAAPQPEPAAAELAPLPSGLAWPPHETVPVAVLMYHHVGPVPPHSDRLVRDLTVSAERFEADLEELKADRCQVLTLRGLYEAVARGQVPPRAVVLTFDDGYADNYTVAWPLLQRHGFRGTFNVISGSVGTPGHMTRSQLAELARAGNDIGSHTVSHPELPNLDERRLDLEVTESRRQLERITGGEVVSFCYPSGRYNQRVLEAVQRAGYRLAVTTRRGARLRTDQPFEIPRLRIEERTRLSEVLRPLLQARLSGRGTAGVMDDLPPLRDGRAAR